MKTIYFAHLIEYEKEPVINTIVKILGNSYNYKFIQNDNKSTNKYINFILKKIVIFIEIFKVKDSIIQSFHIETTLFALLFKKLRNNKIIFNFTEIYSESLSNIGIKSKIISRYYKMIEPYTLKCSDVIIVPSGVRKDYIVKKYTFLDESKINIVENISTYQDDIFDDKNILDALKHKHIVYIGTFKENRKLELLTLTAEKLKKYGIRVYLFGSENDFLKNKMLTTDNVYYFGRIPHNKLLSMLKNCYIGTAIYDDNNINNYLCAPLKIFDYISASIPFVAVNFPYIQVMKDRMEKEVFTTFELNKEDFLNAILKLDKAYEIYKKNIEDLDKHLFKWDSQKDEILTIYNKLENL